MKKTSNKNSNNKEKQMSKKAQAVFEKLSAIDLIGAGYGAIRANELSDKEKKKITKHYGMKEDSSLGWRNAGRGFLGATGGALTGGLAGAAAAGPKSPAGILLALAGGAAGAHAATKKYSKGNPVLKR